MHRSTVLGSTRTKVAACARPDSVSTGPLARDRMSRERQGAQDHGGRSHGAWQR